jgi:hypothetical protein
MKYKDVWWDRSLGTRLTECTIANGVSQSPECTPAWTHVPAAKFFCCNEEVKILTPGPQNQKIDLKTGYTRRRNDKVKRKRKKERRWIVLGHWRPQDMVLWSVYSSRWHPLPHRHARICTHLGCLRGRSLCLCCKGGSRMNSCRVRHVSRWNGHCLHLLL